MRISGPKFRAFTRALVQGTPTFPGTGKLSRFATLAFASAYIDRRDLALDCNVALQALSSDNRSVFREAIYDHKLLLRSVRNASVMPIVLNHFHMRKMITPQEINVLVDTLNQKSEDQKFASSNDGRFWIVEDEAAIYDEADEAIPILKDYLQQMLKRSRPLSTEEIQTELKAKQIDFEPSELTTLLSELRSREIIKLTSDGLIYLAASESILLDAGVLVRIEGRRVLDTNARRRYEMKIGSVSVLLESDQRRYIDVSHANQNKELYMKYYAEVGVNFISVDQVELVQAEVKLVYGISENGERVAIENSPGARKRYASLIENYEQIRLRQSVEALNIPEPEKRRIYQKIKQATQASALPTYRALYVARKVIQLGGAWESAAAFILYDGNLSITRGRLSAIVSDPMAIDQAMQYLSEFESISTWPFSLEYLSPHYIWNIMRMQRQVASNLDVLRMFLIDRISRAVYNPETINMSDAESAQYLDEIRFLCAPVAEQYGFDRLSAQFKDLRLMYSEHSKYLSAARDFQEKTGMSRRNAEDYLRKTIVPEIKTLICRDWVPGLTESEVEVYFRPKSFASIASKTRSVRDLLGIRIVIKSKSIDEVQAEKDALAVIEKIRPHLLNYFIGRFDVPFVESDVAGNPANIRDCIGVPRESGWRGLKLYGFHLAEDQSRNEVEVITQTEQMYWQEKYSQMKQVHWARDINKEIDQHIDQIPDDVAAQLGNDSELNFEILKRADAQQVFAFVLNDNTGAIFFNINFRLDTTSRKKLVYSPKSLTKVIEGKRLRQPTPEDLFCSINGVDPALIHGLARCEIYRSQINVKGQPVLVRRKVKEDEEYFIQNGDIVVFIERPATDYKNRSSVSTHIRYLRHVQKTAQYPRTKLYAWLGERRRIWDYSEKAASYNQESDSDVIRAVSEGRAVLSEVYSQIKERSRHRISGRRRVADFDEIRQVQANAMGFRNEKELLIAAGQRFVSPKQILESMAFIYDNSGFWYEMHEINDGRQEIVFYTQERKGILSQLLRNGVIDQDNLMGIETITYENFGQKRVRVRMIVNSNQRNVDAMTLETSLNELYTRVSNAAASDLQAIFPRIVVFTLKFKVGSHDGQDIFKDIVNYVQGHPGMNIYDVNIPFHRSVTEVEGIIRLELPKSIIEDPDQARDFYEDLSILNVDVV